MQENNKTKKENEFMAQRTEEEVGAARSSRRGGDRSILLRKAMDPAFFLLSSVLWSALNRRDV